MNLKKIAISSTITASLFGFTFSAISQTSDNQSYNHLFPIVDFILNSETSCSIPSPLSISNVTANGSDAPTLPGNTVDGDLNTRWSSDGDNLTTGIINFELDSTSVVTDIEIAWFRGEQRSSSYSIEYSNDAQNWYELIGPSRSQITLNVNEFELNDVEDTTANYIRIIGTGNDINIFTSISEVIINGCDNQPPSTNSSSSSSSSTTTSSGSTSSGSTTSTSSTSSTSSSGGEPDFGLDPNLEPWENFDLTDWALDTPADFATRTDTSRPFSPDNGSLVPDGLADRTMDFDFASNTLVPGSEPFFYTGPDGGMVFKATQVGFRTSTGTSFIRSELREMLRQGDRSINTSGVNENNWVLGYQPPNNELELRSDADGIGGRNGRLAVTLRVNQVTSTGDAGQVGRLIIGQIHAEDDEPIRLYYRKLPFNELGGIYFAHEKHASLGPSDDILVNMIGTTTSRSAPNPENGIALDELFSYEIVNQDQNLIITIRRGDADGPVIASTIYDMTESGYDRADEWMYFRAGAYSQSNTADEDDFDMVTIYRIENTHD